MLQEVPKYSLSVRSTSDNLRFETGVWHQDCLWGWALASVGSARTLTKIFFFSDPCSLYSMTNHCVASRQHNTNRQSPATQLYNNRRLTVHLRLLNLETKKRLFNKTKELSNPNPQSTEVVLTILSILHFWCCWCNPSVKIQITPKPKRLVSWNFNYINFSKHKLVFFLSWKCYKIF